jgi:DNA ligase-1
MPNGVEFGVGGGFSREEREKFWKKRDQMIGQICKYKYFEVGMKDAPRFPSFIGIRSADDMS